MKRFFVSFFGILSVIVFFTLCYYVSFLNISRQLEREKQEQDSNIQKIVLSQEDQNRYPTVLSESSQSAEVTIENGIITADTVCIYEIVDISTGEKIRYETSPGADMAGLSREQLIDKLEKYMNNLSVTEYEDGLVTCELVSFSPKQVVIQKVYDRCKVQFKYVVTIKNNEVIVYYSDYRTVYEYTGISADGLAEEICLALMDGVQVKNIEELYDYLSGITS